ncbi:uncharacterized protein LOC110117036 [Athalia rosae]|uniref:uncharacterized protein LOC110117036 n=1 Tax=Athalia rosae TaxID=37344 RepID=UPI000A0EDFE0|nr:uncharacterized protein LOC110117036 [Athalia rosae]
MPNQKIEHTELLVLARLAGIHAAPGVFRIITELLALQIPPEDIYALLGRICQVPRKKKDDVVKRRSEKIK